MAKNNNRPLLKMVLILLMMAGWFVSLCLAYRNGYIDSRENERHWRENEIEMYKNDNCTLRCQIDTYEMYVKCAEELFDSLDCEYGWFTNNRFAADEYFEILHLINDHNALNCEQN